jgi:nucleotide-binding universal stress UspA family protein
VREAVGEEWRVAELIGRVAADVVVARTPRRRSRSQEVFGEFPVRFARETAVPLILISRRE